MDIGSVITAIEKMNGLQLLGVITFVAILTWVGQYFYKKKKKRKNKNVHHECPFYSDHLLLVEKAIKIFELRELTLIRNQMLLADRATDDIKSSMIASLSDLPGKALRYLDILADKIINNIKDELKIWIKANGLAEKTEIEFRIYSNNIADKILGQIQLNIQQYWDDADWNISRVDIISQLKDSEIIEIILELLIALREESKKIELQITRL